MSGELDDILSNMASGPAENSCSLLETARKEYIQKKILYDCILECARNPVRLPVELRNAKKPNCLSDELSQKVRDIITGEDLKRCLTLDEDKQLFLLGISELPEINLNYTERNELKVEVEKQLLSKANDRRLFEFDEDFDSKQNIRDNLLADFKMQLNHKQDEYVKNLLKYRENLQQLIEFRTVRVPKACELKLEYCEIQAKLNEMKAKSLDAKTAAYLVNELPKSLEAYAELSKDIDEQRVICVSQINHLKELKARYEQVKCLQYDNILKSYKEYKAAIEKKKLLKKHLQGEE